MTKWKRMEPTPDFIGDKTACDKCKVRGSEWTDGKRELCGQCYTEEVIEKGHHKFVCSKCGNDTFRVYCTIIIDDARLYCAKCGDEGL